MKQNFPNRYYLYLILIFIFSALFWWLVLKPTYQISSVYREITRPSSPDEYWQQIDIPEEIAQPIPIDTAQIIYDSISNINILSNIINVALVEKNGKIAELAYDLKTIYADEKYKIVYIDSVVNRLQFNVPEEERTKIKNELKTKLNKYKVLVWDESIFQVNRTFNDPGLSKQSQSWYFSAIQSQNLWNSITGSNDVIIAVIDNGFDLNHEELSNQFIKPYNVVSKSSDVRYNSVNHGTHVASTIIAKGNNNKGIVGICPNCKLMPIKVADNNDYMATSYIIDGILYAIKNGADVVNISLGKQIDMKGKGLFAQNLFIKTMLRDEEKVWDQLFEYGLENNTVCVIAAGNSTLMCGLDPMQRSKNTIKVGSHSTRSQISNFSNFGKYVDLYAPGEKIYGAAPLQNYQFLDGTSMASPIVSGVIGLLRSSNKNMTFAEISKFLQNNSTEINGIKCLKIK